MPWRHGDSLRACRCESLANPQTRNTHDKPRRFSRTGRLAADGCRMFRQASRGAVMLLASYVPGAGYTVRNSLGKVIARGLTAEQRDKLLAAPGVITAEMLEELREAQTKQALLLS